MAVETQKSGSTFSVFLRKLLRLHNNEEVNGVVTSSERPPPPLHSASTSAPSSFVSDRSLVSDQAPSAHIKSGLSPGVVSVPEQNGVVSAGPATTVAFTVGSASGGRPHPSKTATDAASVMTIASSSKRRRRSLDTNASTNALVAESIFSNTESLDTDIHEYTH